VKPKRPGNDKSFQTGLLGRIARGRVGYHFFLALLLGATISCSTGAHRQSGVTAQVADSTPDLSGSKRVVVLDFFEGRHPDLPGTAYVCHLTGINFIPGDVEDGAGEEVADLFRLHLSNRKIEVVDNGSITKALGGIDKGLVAEYGLALGLKTGELTKADAVIMGVVMRFEERSGTKFGSSKPASVSFSTIIVDMKTKKIAWKAKFEKTQKALFSNVFDYKTFFKGGMVWQTAAELADMGVQNVLDQSPFPEP